MSSSIPAKAPSRIRVLPEDLANQIAAGEVVERPASVVKELVENAIDAGSTRIQIDVESGGKKMIRVVDNGCGMSREDAELAFARHATSKISQSRDLERILTLGFRGEALPSIGSIARVRLSTAQDEQQGGTLVVIEGGTQREIRDIACPRGTIVEVGHLFYNTPARRKFLKGDSTELSHITQAVTQQALAYPRIHFTLKHNSREIINTLPTEEPLYRIAELFGPELAKELVRVDLVSGAYKLEGFVSSPVYTRSTRSAQYCFINRRFVRDKVILHATQQGYSHLLPKGQHPAIFLALTMDPELLDVNVHPSKAEVRFAFQQEVHRLVCDGVRTALSDNHKSPFLERAGEGPDPSERPVPADERERGSEFLLANGHSREPYGQKGDSFPSPSHQDLSEALRKMYSSPHGHGMNESRDSPGFQQPFHFDQMPKPVSQWIYSEFEPLGQLDRSFIVLQGKRGIVIVDQHVAHERILYERFRDAAQNRRVEVQRLLFPLAIKFTPDEAELMNSHLLKLKDLGMELEPFGGNEFLLRTVPAILKNNDHEEILKEIAGLLPRGGDPQVLEKRFEEIQIMMACRNAIKVNHTLDGDQIRKLISDLEQTEMPFTCPHGRPIALLFDMEDILKKFLRK